MRLNFCYGGMELDFTLELPTISFSFGPFVDEEPEALPDPVTIRGDSLSVPIGFAPTPMPPWDDPGSFHSLDADDDLEDRRR